MAQNQMFPMVPHPCRYPFLLWLGDGEFQQVEEIFLP